MKVGNTSTGENIYLDGSPFDMAEIIIPEINVILVISNDLANGTSLTIQRASNSSTPVIDWSGHYHNSDSNRKDGNGTITVCRGTNSAKFILKIFNIVDENKANIYFDIHYWNGANPKVQAWGYHCRLQGMTPVQLSNGSTNNVDAYKWSFNAQVVKFVGDEPEVQGYSTDDIVNSVNSAHESEASSYNAKFPVEISHMKKPTYQDLNQVHGYSPDYLKELPLPKSGKIWDLHSLAQFAKDYGYPYNPSDLPTSDNDIDYSRYPKPKKDWDVHKSAMWAKDHGYPYNPDDL